MLGVTVRYGIIVPWFQRFAMRSAAQQRSVLPDWSTKWVAPQHRSTI
jgi:hypothetical protein